MNKKEGKPGLVVGIGGSAGSVEACKAVLDTVTDGTATAFIVLLDTDPARGGQVIDILRQHTRLTVEPARSSERIEPNHVYVVQPYSAVRLDDGRLFIERPDEQPERSGPVDALLASLATVDQERSVGVILSGEGCDGCDGLRQIHAAGGLCIAQTPSSALAAGMPQAAIDTGIVDAVLEPETIPAALAEFAATGLRPGTSGRSAAAGPDDTGEAEPGLIRILELLGAAVDVNFDDYKPGTLQRRTLRRMNLKGIESLTEYVELLAKDSQELNALYHDVLIGVTEFLRDPDVWERLATELPALIEQRDQPGLRIWVPACGTGEEAYSLAMLALEVLPARDRSKIQIYATDLNERALTTARRGVYSLRHVGNVSSDRREQYFRQLDGLLQVDSRIRDCVTFAPHNALGDPPFSNMDIVSCRNLLIYLKPRAHDGILQRLHFALRANALLVLGHAETPGRQSALFEDISKSHSIYRAREARSGYRYRFSTRTMDRFRGTAKAAAMPDPRPRDPGLDRRISQYVLSRLAPACVAINSELQILHFYGPTQQYLVPPTGESRQDLLAWIRPGFYIRLRSALKRAIESGATVTIEGQIERDGGAQLVRCTIEPLGRAIAADGTYLITFRDLGASEPAQVEQTAEEEPIARELEQELLETRRELMSAIEQLEGAGQEHRASHEELLSLNEELQSSNEEHQASKEELEALNEEMNTINRELEDKNSDLRAANSDLNNLFLNIGIPTIFLDRDLNIRRFTPAATNVMRLVPSDVGRSIEDVKERFDDGRTLDEARKVMETELPRSQEIRTEDGSFYLRRLLPYRNHDRNIDGICITFTDVTEQKEAAIVSDNARRYAESVIRHVRTPILVLDQDLRIVTVNAAFTAAFHVASNLDRRPVSDCVDSAWNVAPFRQSLERIVADHKAINDLELQIENRYFLVNFSAITRDRGSELVLVSFEDVTRDRLARVAAEERQAELARDASRKDQWIAMLGHELRNPIGAIANGIELSRSDKMDSGQRAKIYTMLQRQIQQINRLLDDLLDAGRVIAGKLEIVKRPVDVAQVAAWSVETVGPAIQAGRHELSVATPPAGTVWIEGDADRLTEALSNLLGNAAKFTPPDGNIALRVEAEDDVTIVVEDSGTGIPADFMPYIFDVFSQGPRDLDRSAKGLGLGLPLVRQIVELHGGAVDASSDGDGRGSRFTVRLPRMPYDPEQTQDPEQSIATPPRRILLVDDEPDSVSTLAQLLDTLGHETRAVPNGARALAVAESFDPDVVLLDLGMPGMDGYELARKLRDSGCKALVVALTGYQLDEARERQAGIDHHLNKPVDRQQLTALLATASPSRDREPNPARCEGDYADR